jgi:nicotinate phosphoribosyltransferase
VKPSPLDGGTRVVRARLRQYLGEASTGGEEVASMSDATTTDLYEVTMPTSCPRETMTGPAAFSLFVRDLPSDRGFLDGAGLESALDFLSGFRTGFAGQVRAVPEGRIAPAGEPLLKVTAPLSQARLVETCALDQLVDFSRRRTHGPQAGFQAARLSAMAGFAGTSDVVAAATEGEPAVGTMAGRGSPPTWPGCRVRTKVRRK